MGRPEYNAGKKPSNAIQDRPEAVLALEESQGRKWSALEYNII
jgi:hypothetical protein